MIGTSNGFRSVTKLGTREQRIIDDSTQFPDRHRVGQASNRGKVRGFALSKNAWGATGADLQHKAVDGGDAGNGKVVGRQDVLLSFGARAPWPPSTGSALKMATDVATVPRGQIDSETKILTPAYLGNEQQKSGLLCPLPFDFRDFDTLPVHSWSTWFDRIKCSDRLLEPHHVSRRTLQSRNRLMARTYLGSVFEIRAAVPIPESGEGKRGSRFRKF